MAISAKIGAAHVVSRDLLYGTRRFFPLMCLLGSCEHIYQQFWAKK